MMPSRRGAVPFPRAAAGLGGTGGREGPVVADMHHGCPRQHDARIGLAVVKLATATRSSPPLADGRTVDFIVVPDRAQLSEIVRRARDGRVRTNISKVVTLDDAVAAFNPTERVKGKTIIRVCP